MGATTPVEPEFPEPVEPTPVEPEFPEPVEPTPVEPTPVEPEFPEPVEPTPVEPEFPVPVEPTPVEPELVDCGTVGAEDTFNGAIVLGTVVVAVWREDDVETYTLVEVFADVAWVLAWPGNAFAATSVRTPVATTEAATITPLTRDNRRRAASRAEVA